MACLEKLEVTFGIEAFSSFIKHSPIIYSFNKHLLLLLSRFSRVRLCVTP